MSITIGAIALPDNLIWSDEMDWSAVEQEVVYIPAVGGRKPLVIETPNTAGRPITLTGGNLWAWVTRTNLLGEVGANANLLRSGGLSVPPAGKEAVMLKGAPAEVAQKILEIIKERGGVA